MGLPKELSFQNSMKQLLAVKTYIFAVTVVMDLENKGTGIITGQSIRKKHDLVAKATVSHSTECPKMLEIY